MARAEDIAMQVLKPDDKSLHTQDTINVVVRIDPDSFDTIKIVSNAIRPITIVPKAELDTYCQNVPLSVGNNKIRIRIYSEGKKVAEKIRNIYYSAPLSNESKYPPKDYSRAFFHTESEEKRCSSCHDMRVNEKKDIAFIDVTESNCYLCHKSVNAKKQTHSPSVNWLCTRCHDGGAGERNAVAGSRFMTPKPSINTCINCHEMKKRLWKEKRYKHYPVASGQCENCHNPHASDNRFALHKPAWNLCRSCHSVKPSQAVYLQRFEQLSNHPMDPKNSGKALSCTTCHDPHVSDREFFLREEYSGDRSICR